MKKIPMIVALIVIIVIIIIIVLIFRDNSESVTHVHPKPHFDQRKNTLTFNTSPHALKYSIFKEVIVTDENRKKVWNTAINEMTGTETGLVLLAEQDHDQTSGTVTVQLPLNQTIEAQQIHLKAVTTTGSVDTVKVVTSTQNSIRTYTGVFQPESPPGRGIIIQETGSTLFVAQAGSLITVDVDSIEFSFQDANQNKEDVLKQMCLYACNGPNCSTDLFPIGNFVTCGENASLRYCNHYPSQELLNVTPGLELPPGVNVCDTCTAPGSEIVVFEKTTDSQFTHGTIILSVPFPFSDVVVKFTFTIDETSIVNCGPSCLNPIIN